MRHLPKTEALLRSIDKLIETHAKDNSVLREDLLKHRKDIENACLAGRWLDVASAASRIALLVKFLFDHLPPPH